MYSGWSNPHNYLDAFRQVSWVNYWSPNTHRRVWIDIRRKSTILVPNSSTTCLFKDFDKLGKEFVATFSKRRIKHNVVAFIFEFAQKEAEIGRDCANCLRQYIARCSKGKMPSQACLTSIFLFSLKNKPLQAHLYAKQHATLNACIRSWWEFVKYMATQMQLLVGTLLALGVVILVLATAWCYYYCWVGHQENESSLHTSA